TERLRAAERARARGIYMKRVGEMNRKILEYNVIRPRQLSWLEKVQVSERAAGEAFDAKVR
ncbi:MAG TPA: hypothetical protein VFN74_15205, partial [Chloroflexota bacterium]|nr:hypothetical protein [Chloroflexota bacterium]